MNEMIRDHTVEPHHNGRVTYVKVRARLFDDNRLTVRFDGPTARPLQAVEDETRIRLWAELVDSEDRLLLRHALSERRTDTVEAHPHSRRPDYRRLHAHLPLAHGTKHIRFSRDGIVLQKVDVPPDPPSLKIVQNPPRSVEGPFLIRWEADEHVRCRLYYTMGGGTWMPVSGWLDRRSVILDPADLPGGEACRLRVLATDGFVAVDAATTSFTVGIKPCVALIVTPSDNERLPATVVLRGQGWWQEEQRAETAALYWDSSIDGKLGSGPVCRAHLSPGTHVLRLVAGSGARAGQATIAVQVGKDLPLTRD